MHLSQRLGPFKRAWEDAHWRAYQMCSTRTQTAIHQTTRRHRQERAKAAGEKPFGSQAAKRASDTTDPMVAGEHRRLRRAASDAPKPHSANRHLLTRVTKCLT